MNSVNFPPSVVICGRRTMGSTIMVELSGVKILHELGHELDDHHSTAPDVMSETLSIGTRWLLPAEAPFTLDLHRELAALDAALVDWSHDDRDPLLDEWAAWLWEFTEDSNKTRDASSTTNTAG